MHTDFLLLYEKESRELESLVLLQCVLEDKGYSCRISASGGYDYWRSFFFSKPRVVVVPYLRSDNDLFYFTKFYKWKIENILDLQIEQVYNRHDLESGFCSITGFSKLVHHICWGKNSAEQLSRQGISEDKIHTTGAIQFDIYKLNFEDYILSKQELAQLYNLDMTKRWRLFISSFSYCNRPGVQNLVEKYGINDFIKISESSQKFIMDWYTKAYDEGYFKDEIILYRKHPDEIISPIILNYAKKNSNFKIISSLPIRNWINASDEIDTWYSTSLFDIIFLNKPCSILRPVRFPDELDISLFDGIPKITTYEQFVERLDMFDSKQFEYPNIDKYVGEKNEIAVLNIADLLIQMLNDKNDECDKILYRVDGSYKRIVSNLISSFICSVYAHLGVHLSRVINLRKFKTIDSCIGTKERIRVMKSRINILLRKNNLIH